MCNLCNTLIDIILSKNSDFINDAPTAKTFVLNKRHQISAKNCIIKDETTDWMKGFRYLTSLITKWINKGNKKKNSEINTRKMSSFLTNKNRSA